MRKNLSKKQARLKELSFRIKCNKELYLEQVKKNDIAAEETRKLLYELLAEYERVERE